MSDPRMMNANRWLDLMAFVRARRDRILSGIAAGMITGKRRGTDCKVEVPITASGIARLIKFETDQSFSAASVKEACDALKVSGVKLL